MNHTGKYYLHRLFQKYKSIRPYLPSTSICNIKTLTEYFNKYKSVYIKPVYGGRGVGVAKAWKMNKKYCYVLERGNPVVCSSIQQLYRKLGLDKKKSYIVQRGIQLATYQRRPIDIRLMMMRDPHRKWKYVGMLAKVAGNKSIITNVARGRGYAITVEKALKGSLGLNSKEVARKKIEMIKLGYLCNRAYSRYRYDWQIGYDIGIDKSGKVWLIESNPRTPSHSLFAHLKDKTIYYKIRRMAVAYRKKFK